MDGTLRAHLNLIFPCLLWVIKIIFFELTLMDFFHSFNSPTRELVFVPKICVFIRWPWFICFQSFWRIYTYMRSHLHSSEFKVPHPFSLVLKLIKCGLLYQSFWKNLYKQLAIYFPKYSQHQIGLCGITYSETMLL